ncbi:saccharopine dehydrogenase family protein [Actinocorallia sp. A-T 12471]|uniref:saccharopine dehydrogenase family protein n=1 Tax=Actinocorallia sp. A-T 12471 TaxID=3089813 RepID=UPI0029CCF110|nr:saccharopine dehydrogenase NADP-binding domain-containing protein [Actinocorallia sp. A-T 12471]MDX6740274.1 saccharopine dehydrogenase NADP-binding domain-containing protein [Actinocorallia sp. A-T 12471]
MGRPYDAVLYGATGFTGGLTAEYLAAHAGETRWALAGRDLAKLERVRDRIGVDVPLLHADAGDPASLDALARSTRLVISTVGPYLKYGEPLVAACAEHGTDYVDLTGEPAFVDLMYLRHHRRAVETGARLVHACGFDSIPYDLGVYYTVQRLPENVPLRVEGFVSANGSASGGTVASFLGVLRDPLGMRRAAAERAAVEPLPQGRRARIARSPLPRTRVHGGVPVPLPTLDPQIVVRSARALERYGPDFTYAHFFAFVRGGGLGGSGGLRATLRQTPGEGPSAEQRAKNWFKARFQGEGGGVRIATEVAGGDPGYTETAKMLSESALCLLHDDLPATAGQVTTAQAMGDALIARLQRAGITFRTL